MKRSTTMKQTLKPIVAACTLALAAGQADALDVYLIAKPFDMTLPGQTTPTSMWGYAEDVGGACYNATPADAACTTPTATAPGPRITIDPSDPVLNIYLTNLLPEGTSIVIPGQPLPQSAGSRGPTWNDGSTGNRPAGNYSLKMRSYGLEAPAGGTQVYTWDSTNPIDGGGTLIYHTGTLPQKQLYMGLYGALTKDALAGNVVYDLDSAVTGDEVSYQNDVILFYSDIDPAFNEAVVAGTLETAIERHPSWFLVNGQPYQAGATTPLITAEDGSPLTTAGPTLLRFLSAASEKHVPILQGLYGTIHGEDGIQYTWQDTSTDPLTVQAAPVQQYSVGLPPLKTKDVMVQPTFGGQYAVYDGNGYMTNPSDPANETVGDEIGGMLRFLGFNVGANQAPLANADAITIGVPEIFDAVAPFEVNQVIDVLANDLDPDNDPITLTALVTPVVDNTSIAGVDLTFNCTTTNCDMTVSTSTFPAATGGPVSFQYEITAGGATSAGSVDLTLVLNAAPDFSGITPLEISPADLDAGNLYSFNLGDLVAGAIDAEGDAVTVVTDSVSPTDPLLSCDYVAGTCSYDFSTMATPPQQVVLGFTGTDGTNVVANLTKTINLLEPGVPAAFADGPITLGQIATANLLDNDLNLPVSYGLMIVTAPGDANAVATVNGDGTFTYTTTTSPFAGDSFTYCITDGAATPACLSNEALVTLEATPPSLLVANPESYVTDEDAVLDVAALDGVLANETPINGGTLEAISVATPSCGITGSFVLNPDGSFHYEPLLNWNSTSPPVDDADSCNLNDTGGARGADSFTYFIRETYADGNGGTATLDSNTVTADITVNATNDAPVAANDLLYLQDAALTVLDPDGQPLNVTFSIAAPGVLGNDTDLENDTLSATEVNDPDNLDPQVFSDGSVAPIFIDNDAVGVLGSISYQASDGNGGVSAIAQADFVRLVTVNLSNYHLRNNPNNPANDDWRIRGILDPSIPNSAGVQAVHVFLNKVGYDNLGNLVVTDSFEIVPTVTNAFNGRIRTVNGTRVWGINANNIGNTVVGVDAGGNPVTLMPDDNDTLSVRVDGYPDAVYENYPIAIQPD